MSESLGARGTLWRVASPYFNEHTVRWIDASIPDDVYRFERVQAVGSARDWHARRNSRSSLGEWGSYVKQANSTLSEPSDGIITVFPQLAAAAATVSRLRRDQRPIVSWFFNTTLDGGLRRRSARLGLSRVDHFVVHSTVEVEAYARLLALPVERFSFVPLQYGSEIETQKPDLEEPYVFATGSGFRDYATFFEAMDRLGYPTRVVAGPRVLSDLTPPPNVEIVNSMPIEQIRRHVRHAKVNVIPLRTVGLTAGLVTIVECLRHGRGLVSTARSGTEDYLVDGHNALLALPGNVDSLSQRIEALWTDDKLSRSLDANALAFADLHCTDVAAGAALVGILDGVMTEQLKLAA